MIEGPYKLPEGWRWVRLGEVCETKMGGTPSTKDAQYWEPPEIVWVTPEDLEKCEVNRVSSSRRLISCAGLKKSSAKLFQHKTVLLSTTATIGKVGVAEKPLSANQQISGIICGDNVNPEFLAYYLLRLGETGLKQLGGTATATHINQTNLRSLPIPLPPLNEQRRIVARIEELMERVREAKRLRRQAKEDTERLWQSALAETFPRPGTEPPPGWRWVRLGEACEVWDTLRKPVKKKDRIPGNVPYCGANGVIDYVDGHTHAGEFVLLAEDGGFYGPGEPTAYIMSGRFWANNHVHILRGRPDHLVNQLLYYCLVAYDLRPFLTGATRPKLTQGAMRSIPIPLPPLEEQRRIVAHLEALREKIKDLKEIQATTEAELQLLEQAILDRAFRGEL